MDKEGSLEIARALFSKFIGDFYGMDHWDQSPDGFSFQSKICTAPGILKKLGLADRKDFLCGAHEKYWQTGPKKN